MTTASSPSSCEDRSACTGGQSSTNSAESEDRAISWATIVPVVLIGAVVLLVGLPLGAVFFMNKYGCCLANGPENVVTFWASMTGGFLALFGMIITGVFIITAFRVDATAKAKAKVVAQEAVWNYLKNEQAELAKDLKCVKVLVKKVKECGENAQQAIVAARDKTTDAASEAREAIAQAQQNVQAQQGEASSAIAAARDATTTAASQAQEGIAKALNETTSAAAEAQEAIGRAGQEVDRQRDEAIRAIDGARQEAEAAAREVRERADRGIEGPAPTEGDDPEQRDE